MLKLVIFQDKPFFNGSDIAQTVSEHFYLKGFPFDQTVIAMPDDLASIKATAVADKGNYYVFLNPTEYVIGENIRSIKQIALEKDLIAVIGELERVTGKSYGNCVLKAFGADNSALSLACKEADRFCDNSAISYNLHTEFGDTKIIIAYDSTSPKMAVDGVIKAFVYNLKEFIYAEDDVSLEQQLFNLLTLRGKVLSTAESFTAGRIASRLITIPGSSAVFHEGIVAYSNISKETRLGVDRETLFNYGAVSAECCSEMAEGLLSSGKCDIAVCSTGIAGPKSDNTLKPVGLCYIGVGMENGIDVYKYNFNGTREEITETAVRAAIFNAVKRLKYL